jgi:selenocysteine lyase/cysteine desulfurase
MDAAGLRASIPATERCTYLNTGATGPSPTQVVEATTAYLERHQYAAPCGEGPYQVASDARESAREAVAGLLGASSDDVALTRNTVEGVNLVANGLDWEPGDVVVRTDLEHGAGILPWARLEREAGVEVRVLETTDGRLDMDALKTALADARLCCLSSLTWNYGTRLPIADVVDVAHDAGARVLVDAVQSVGQQPVAVDAWGADFVAASGHKWLLGPWGAGMLYVAADALEALTPPRIGYFSVEDAYADPFTYEAGAKRLELGTTAIAPYVGLERAIDLFEDIGLETVEARIAALAGRLAEGLGDRLVGPADPESGLVSFAVDDPEATVERLAEHGIVIRDLPDPAVCRASVHAFNTAEEVDALLAALE